LVAATTVLRIEAWLPPTPSLLYIIGSWELTLTGAAAAVVTVEEAIVVL
jgi:hypothetical protein